MNITHVCLCGLITEGFSYQENMLVKYHTLLGHKVSVITSQWIRSKNKTEIITNYIDPIDNDILLWLNYG